MIPYCDCVLKGLVSVGLITYFVVECDKRDLIGRVLSLKTDAAILGVFLLASHLLFIAHDGHAF